MYTGDVLGWLRRRAERRRRRRRARKAFLRLLKEVRRFCRGVRGPEGWGPLFEMVRGVYAQYEEDLPPRARLRLQEAALQIREDSPRQALDAA